MKNTHKSIIATAAVAALTAVPASGNGFYIPVQAPEATSRGNAFVATANTAAAVYYNAAGLTQLTEDTLQFGIYSVNLGLDANIGGTSVSAKDQWQAIPQIYVAKPINDRLVLGFGLNTPFGLSTEWGNDSPFRNATGAVKAEILYGTLWAVAGYKVTDTFSVGLGVGVSQLDGELHTGLGAVPGGPVLEFSGDDTAVAWTVSARWQPQEQHAFGIVYRSQTDFNAKGSSRVKGVGKVDSSLGFITPATLAVGYSFRPTSKWNIEANIEWVNWEKLNTLTLKNTPVAAAIPIPFNWDNNLIYGIGATRQLGNGYSFSFGYNYIENSQPDSTFTPAVSDADRHWLTLGVGHKGECWSWDFAYQYAFSDRRVKNVAGPLAPALNGKYKSRFHSLSLSATYEF
ncbi:MAG: OmpP1/FadL family transporter [Akkermansiaceae bacterium]